MSPLGHLPLVPRLTVLLLALSVVIQVIVYLAVPTASYRFPWVASVSFLAMLLLLNILHPWLAGRPPHDRRKAITVGALLFLGPPIAEFAMMPLLALWPAAFGPIARLSLTAPATRVTEAGMVAGSALFMAGLFLHDADRRRRLASSAGPARVDQPKPSP